MVDLSRLEQTGADGIVAVRLMRAANDLAAANAGWRHANRDFPRLEKHMQDGLRRYYVRLQCGHLTEAMDLIPEVTANSRLLGLIDRCSQDARAAFGRLVNCTKNHPKRKEFERYVISLRHQVAFHYDSGGNRSGLEAQSHTKRDAILTRDARQQHRPVEVQRR